MTNAPINKTFQTVESPLVLFARWGVVPLFLFICLQAQVANAKCEGKDPCYRAFDLGGSGLKTALFDRKLNQLTPLERLGYAPAAGADAWLRAKIPGLDAEIGKGILFGFSLAGLEKLWADKVNNAHGKKVPELFRIPLAEVFVTTDGTAHLLAARHLVGKKVRDPQVNFALGTGVGFALTNSKGVVRKGKELRSEDGKWPWDLKAKGEKAAWESLGVRGWDEIVHNFADGDAQKAEYERRWRLFYTEPWTALVKSKGWTPAATVTFTGGVTAISPLVGQALKSLDPLGGARVFVVTNGGDAGLLGAAILAKKGKSSRK
jgi:hypothetical protein